jgi:hypothetical protein
MPKAVSLRLEEGRKTRMTGHIDRDRQWRLALARATSAFLLGMTLSGLSLWLLPFSVPNQILVLVHTLAGVLLFLPMSYYLLTHWLLYRRHQMTHIKLAGYVGLFVLALCNLSGLALSVQAVVGPRISYTWDTVHIVTAFAILAFVAPHILAIVARDRKARLPGMSAHGKGVGLATAASPVAVLLLVYAYVPLRLSEELPPDYSFAFGPDRPFAPSLAVAATGKAYDARLLAGSEGCGTAGCHPQIYAEWQVSAHRYAAMDTAFQAIQLNMARQNGPDSTRYCGGCHDPISLFSGAKNLFTDPSKLTALAGYREGVSCLSCHAIREVDVKGNANFLMGQPTRYLFEIEHDQNPTLTLRLARDFLIRAYPREGALDPGGRLGAARAADFDQDGFTDILALLEDGRALLFPSRGGDFRGSPIPIGEAIDEGAVVVDMDGDGWLDVRTSKGAVLRNRQGSFHGLSESASLRGDNPEVLDLDGDGKLRNLIAGKDGIVRLSEVKKSDRQSFVRIALEGKRTNRQAVGAVVELKTPLPGGADDGDSSRTRTAPPLVPPLPLPLPQAGGEEKRETLLGALTGGTPSLALRYRYEQVEDGSVNTAQASTLRTALGYRTLPYHGVSFFVQAQNVAEIGTSYSPAIVDPSGTRMQQVYGRIDALGSTLDFGRREIAYGDHRFVGDVGWRQNHQAFDALHLSNRSIPRTTLSYTFAGRVIRVDSGEKDMSSHFLNAGVKLRPDLSLEIFGYLLDYDDEKDAPLSSQSYGGKLSGSRAFAGKRRLLFEAQYAKQRDFAANPNRRAADYLHLFGGVGLSERLTVKVGRELLGGSPEKGAFQTPLATLFKFNGWADKFLVTPTGGLIDWYASSEGKLGSFGWAAAYHDFHSDAGSDRYGFELDARAVMTTRWKQSFGLSAAFYRTEGLASDTSKLWFWTEYGF